MAKMAGGHNSSVITVDKDREICLTVKQASLKQDVQLYAISWQAAGLP